MNLISTLIGGSLFDRDIPRIVRALEGIHAALCAIDDGLERQSDSIRDLTEAISRKSPITPLSLKAFRRDLGD
jgi:hypothetical protein